MPSAHPRHLAALKRLLGEGHQPGYDELTARLGIGRRQARRVVKALRDEGVPVQERREGRRKVFYLRPEDQPLALGAPDLTEHEWLALTVAAEASRATLGATPLGDALETAFEKLVDRRRGPVRSFEPAHERQSWHFEAGPVSTLDPEVFETVRQAITEKRSLRIRYTAASGTESWNRRIDPYLIAAVRGSWLLVAYDHHPDRITNFSLAAISEATPGDPFAGTHPDFDPEMHFHDAFGAVEGGDVQVVRLRVAAEKAHAFRRKVYHRTQQIERDEAEGLVVSYEVAGLDEIAAFVRSWGPGVTVLDPPALAERLRRDTEAMAEAYRGE